MSSNRTLNLSGSYCHTPTIITCPINLYIPLALYFESAATKSVLPVVKPRRYQIRVQTATGNSGWKELARGLNELPSLRY